MKVLVAEDDRTSRHLLESFLMKWGFEVFVRFISKTYEQLLP